MARTSQLSPSFATRSLALAGVAILALGAATLAQSVRFGATDAPERQKGTIRLATYNVLNLFDDRDDPSLRGDHDDCYSYDKTVRAKPDAERKAVADAIRRANPDIIGLQELESFDALIEFRENYLADMGYTYAVSIDVGQERGIEQGVLSRFPIREARVWPNMPLGGVHPDKYGNQDNWSAGQPIEYRRSPLFVRIEVPADAAGADKPYDLQLFVIHHKSGRYNDYWRDKEAAKLIEMIAEIQRDDPGANIAVLGDFNATPDDDSVKAYESAGMSHVIDRSGGHASDPARITHSSGRAIDFIFVNPALRNEIVEGSAFVLGTPVLDEGKDWRTEPSPPGYASDHMPLCVDIVPVNK